MKKIIPSKKPQKAAKQNSFSQNSIALEVKQHPLNQIVFDGMKRYGFYTLQDRAIPAIQDGLKPVQRRALWAMHTLGIKDTGYKVKSAKVTGTTAGSFHPHGTGPCYQAMVRLAAHIPTPLIYGEGNWGKYPNEEAAAERYTTCRFSKFGYKVLFDPYYIRVSEMVPNYDGTSQEPSVLPALLPMSLIVPQSGIAVAVSTNIPSFTPESIIKTVSQMLKAGKSPSPKWLSENLEWSSAYGGKVISSSKDLIPVMKDGYGKVEWECDYFYDGKNTIIIRGIPPEWNIDGKITAMAKEKYVAEISDQTDKDGLKIVIRLKRTNEESIDENIQKIMKHLRITQTISINCLSISVKDEDGFRDTDSNFKRRSVIDILEEWLEWRIVLEVKALTYELGLVEESLKKDRLLKQTIENLDLIFSLLKKKGINKVEELAKKMTISIKESEYIWSIAVGRLDKLSESSINESISKSMLRKKQINLGLKTPKESTLTQLSSMKIPVNFKKE